MSVSQYDGGSIEDGDLVLWFTAKWCGPCKRFAPTFDRVMNGRPERGLVVDVDQHPALAAQYDIMTIPMLILERDGEVLDAFAGVQSEDALVKKLDEVFG